MSALEDIITNSLQTNELIQEGEEDNPNVFPCLHPLVFTRHIFPRLTEHFVDVQQTGVRNYEIYNTFGSRMYVASVHKRKERHQATCFSCRHAYEIFIWNHIGNQALRVECENGCGGHGAGLVICSADFDIIGRVCQEPHGCFLEYLAIDNEQPGNILLKFKGPRREFRCCGGLGGMTDDFAIFSVDDIFIGRITQQWDGLGENFIQDDESSYRTYGVAVPIEMTANLKAIVMCFLLLLDSQFYPTVAERQMIKANHGYIFRATMLLILIVTVTFIMSYYLLASPEYKMIDTQHIM